MGMESEQVMRIAYEPPTVTDLGTLVDITRSADNQGIADAGIAPNHKT
jgi:hypothetical protein